MSAIHRRIGAAAVALTIASLSGSAVAEPEEAKAQSLFVEGRAALEKGDYGRACAKFTESLGLVRRASTLLNLAQCEEHAGLLVSASRHWKQGIELLPPADERVAISKERAAALAKRLPRLTVKLPADAPAGARVRVEGVDASSEELLAGAPADPGRHAVVLTLPGRDEQRSTVELAEGENRVLALTVAAPSAPEPPPPPPSQATNGKRVAGFVLGGVGIAGLVGAGVTGGILVSKHSQITGKCPDLAACKDPDGSVKKLIDGTKGLNVANGVAWGVGLAGVASGVVLILLGRDKTETQIAPAPVAGGAGLWVTGRY